MFPLSPQNIPELSAFIVQYIQKNQLKVDSTDFVEIVVSCKDLSHCTKFKVKSNYGLGNATKNQNEPSPRYLHINLNQMRFTIWKI